MKKISMNDVKGVKKVKLANCMPEIKGEKAKALELAVKCARQGAYPNTSAAVKGLLVKYGYWKFEIKPKSKG